MYMTLPFIRPMDGHTHTNTRVHVHTHTNTEDENSSSIIIKSSLDFSAATLSHETDQCNCYLHQHWRLSLLVSYNLLRWIAYHFKPFMFTCYIRFLYKIWSPACSGWPFQIIIYQTKEPRFPAFHTLKTSFCIQNGPVSMNGLINMCLTLHHHSSADVSLLEISTKFILCPREKP